MNIDFAALFSLSPNPYVLLDSSLVIVWMNEAYLQATMQTREAIIGRKIFDAFPSEPGTESHDMLAASFERVLKTGQPDELALIRYDILQTDGTMAERFWSATHTPICDEDGKVAYILQHTVDVSELHGLRRFRDELGIKRRADAVQSRNISLRAESERLHRLFDQAPGFVAVLSGPDHVFQMANAAYYRLVDGKDLIGRSVAEALPEVVAQGFVRLLDEVVRTGKSYVGRAEKVMLDIGGKLEESYLDFIYQPMFEDDGEATGVIVQGHDVTEEVMARSRQELLINELNHRVKNTLAIVQGLASQSFRGVDASGEARAAFDQRLRALAAAHDLLTQQKWQSTTLLETLRTAIEAATGEEAARFTLEGPDALLAPQTAVALSMGVHELCTNAIKYGALSRPGGNIGVEWHCGKQADSSDAITIVWTEMGGPEVTPPTRKGFGTRLIERGFAAEHGGEATIEYRPEGIVCRIVLRTDECPE